MDYSDYSNFYFNGMEAVVFDFDGTLATVSVDFTSMRSGVLDRIRAQGLPTEPFEGLFALEMVTAVERNLRTRPDQAARFRKDTLGFIQETELAGARQGQVFDGVPDLLARLRGMNIATAVVTRNCRAAVLTIYPDIVDHADVVITRDEAEKVKPHPAHLLAALAHLGKEPDRSLMVGDHPMDIATGKAAGTKTAGVLTGMSSREALENAGSDVIFERVTELLSAAGVKS